MRKKVFFLLLASCLAAAAGCAGQGAAPDNAVTVSPGGEAEPTTVQGNQEIPDTNNSDKENQNDSVSGSAIQVVPDLKKCMGWGCYANDR